MNANTIINIVLGCVTIASVIATIIFGVRNMRLADKSLETAQKSTDIAKDVYLTSIRPSFQIISEAQGIAPLYIERDIYNERIKDLLPGWWGEFPYIYLKNVGNGTAFEVKVILTHSVRGDITIPLGNIAQRSETVLFIVPKERKIDVDYQGRYIEKYIKINWVDQIFTSKGKVNKATIICKDLDDNSIKPIEIILPFKTRN